MSFLTMLGPSPDWNVGLSGEDLCTKDCGWVQRLVADLIPWDAGTDSGVTYEVLFCVLLHLFLSETENYQIKNPAVATKKHLVDNVGNL